MLEHAPECTEARCIPECPIELFGGSEGVSRFFYCGKPAGPEIRDNPHPMKKPVRLAEELARLIGADGERLAAPWCGSGSELVGALRAGWRDLLGVEADSRWLRVAERRLRQEGAEPRGP